VADKKELLLIEIREDGARVVKRHIDDIGASGDKTTDIMSKLKGVIAGLVSAKVLRDVIMLGDAYANMLNRLRVVTSSNYELQAAMDAVYKMSRETRTSLEANVDMYARVAINTKQMGLEMKDVVRFSTQLNHAIILSGVTAREAQWGMVQFSQALASNALRGDELRAVLEQLPVVTDVISDHFGVTRGELRELGFQGRITAKEIIQAFEEAEESLAERFEKRIPTIDQGITVLRASLVRFIGTLDQTYQLTSSLAGAMLLLADNMDTVGRIAAIAGGVLGTVFLKNLIQIVAQMKLFSVTMIAAHPIAAVVLTAAAAIAVFADKIDATVGGTVKLSHIFSAFADSLKVVARTLKETISNMTGGVAMRTEFQFSLQEMLTDAARFIDAFLGLFVGAGQVIAKVFKDLPRYGKIAWNALLSGLEQLKDTVNSLFKTIGDSFYRMALNLKGGMIMFADQATLSFKNAATKGFGQFSTIFRENLNKAMSEDSLAGAKFKVTAAGETLGQAFMRGFNMSTFIEGGIIELFDRAALLAKGDVGRGGAAAAKWSPTPVQSQLIKEMTGDAGRLVGEIQALNEMWEVVSQTAEDKRIFNFEQYTRKLTELRIEAMAVRTDVMGGFQRGWLQLGLDISNFAEMSEQTITNAFKGMEDALVDFVTKGKVDFKSLVDSILADLTRLLARQMFMKALNLIPGGDGLLNLATETTATPGKRALGGPVSPGVPYVVGERMPEIFTPAQPGHVTPVTQAPQQAPAEADGGITIINVASKEEALAAMQSAEGKRVIMNEIRTYKGQS